MGSVNFYLKKPEEKSGRSFIYLQYKYNGRKLVFGFGQTIDPGPKLKTGGYKNWDTGSQRVKSNRVTTEDGKYSLNDMLDSLEKFLLKAYHAELKNGIPEPQVLKLKLINYINKQGDEHPQSDFFSLADRFVSGEIKYRGKQKASNTTKTYNTVRGHLKAFELAKRYPISFDTITLDFYYKYVSYLRSERTINVKRGEKVVKMLSPPLSQNTIAKHIQVIKVILNEAFDLKYTANTEFKNKKFSATWIESDAVYLSDAELTKLYKHDFSRNKTLDRVRDLFIFGCYVGLRFSDYSDVKPENIISVEGEKFLRINTKKTGEQVLIPCSPVVLEIFKKYKDNPNSLPRAMSNQKFNDYIKEALKEACMNETGRLLTEPEKPLWECVSSHTARRSFATNLYLEGFPTLDIMKITGHRQERNFLKYIRVSKLDTAKRLSAHMKKKWSEKLLRVA